MLFASSPTPRSDRLLSLSIFLGLLHHLDHILRADHSGWPFVPAVTPFTFSLAIYPLLFAALFVKSRPWLRFVLVLPVFGFAQFAHMMIETPHDQFNTWAAGRSDFVERMGDPNLLGLASPLLGYLSVVLSVALTFALIATLFSLARDALQAESIR